MKNCKLFNINRRVLCGILRELQVRSILYFFATGIFATLLIYHFSQNVMIFRYHRSIKVFKISSKSLFKVILVVYAVLLALFWDPRKAKDNRKWRCEISRRLSFFPHIFGPFLPLQSLKHNGVFWTFWVPRRVAIS